MDELVFAYGTLLEADVQTEYIGRVVTGIPDILHGYGKSSVVIENITYPILIPDKNGVIPGKILKLTAEELKKVDDYEEDAYRRVKVKLNSGAEAWVYVK